MLYHKTLNYKSLRVFGSRCHPYVWDQKTSKFDTKSLPCVFLGYSDRHKGYRCYYPPIRRTFISRHVAFDEDSLYLKTQVSNNKSASDFLVTTFKEWDFSKSPVCSHSLPSANTKHLTPNARLNKQLILSNLVFGAELQSNTVPAMLPDFSSLLDQSEGQAVADQSMPIMQNLQTLYYLLLHTPCRLVQNQVFISLILSML
ncbi:hypothetical protein Pint_30527 [Pistacia integerrima]|uniref:Uncharacterized protein n=1 Tax=Pistacia integerrima TaxID=434235 RepID=A0ACC0WYW0_9ROSI|nr:hypothetical protein Pint_30527 [Pistacia integerrima]